ncbi:MAG: response regulator transcription factor [Caldisericota bacterium]|nr:response regulator transcription factor [Caldisericota bacterium]
MTKLGGPGGEIIRRIAVVEDDADIRELIGLYLQRESLEPLLFASPVRFLAWLDAQPTPPDLLVLDLMMPELSGVDVIRDVRRRPSCSVMPIVVCSARTTESDVILTLGIGADTFIKKPFNPREMVAQVAAMLRRPSSEVAVPPVVSIGVLAVDSSRKAVTVKGKRVELTPTEYRIVAVLAERSGTVVSREDLLRTTGEADMDGRSIDVHMVSIRRKLGSAGSLIRTSRSFGYYIDEEPS